MEQAGADALELNVYYIATDAKESAADVEKRTLDVVRDRQGPGEDPGVCEALAASSAPWPTSP
jgi:dihydroorotate dehydrogenase (fumarate)